MRMTLFCQKFVPVSLLQDFGWHVFAHFPQQPWCPSLKFTKVQQQQLGSKQPSNFGIAWQWWVRSVLHFPFSFLLLQGRVLPPPPLNHYSVVCHHHKVALSSLANSCLSTPDFQKKTYNCYSKNSRGNESFLWLFDSDKKNLKIKTNNRHDWQKPIFSFKLWDLYFWKECAK